MKNNFFPLVLSIVTIWFSGISVSGKELLNYDFSEGLHGWCCPSYWSGKIKTENGVLRIVPGRSGGKSWARLYCLYAKPANLNNKILKFSTVLSGKGTARLGAIIYTQDFLKKRQMQFVWGPEFLLNSTAAVHQYQIDLLDFVPYQIAPCIEVTGDETATCHKIFLSDITPPQSPELQLSQSDDKNLIPGPFVYRKLFEKGTDGWTSPSYWGGELSWKKEEKCLQLTATKQGGRIYGRIYSVFRSGQPLTGSSFIFSARVKGTGKVRLGMIAYGTDQKNQMTYPVIWSQEGDLTELWQNTSFVLDLSHRSPTKLALRIELTTPGTVYVDRVSLRPMLDPSLEISASPEIILLRDGQKYSDLHFTISKPVDRAVLFSPDTPASPIPTDVKPDKDGIVRIKPEQFGKGTPIQLAAGGKSASVTVENLSPSIYDKFDETAKKIKLEKPLNILVIGDSLLDCNFSLNKGNDVMKQLAFWLTRYNPRKITIRNAAVRGDTIERVWDRMSYELKSRKNPIFEQSVYQGLFQFPADLIFVQLGHNDTVSSSQQDFKTPQVTPQLQEDLYRKMLTQIRKVWPHSKIVLVSPTSSNYVLTKNKAEKALKQKSRKKIMLYGIPSFAEAFNAVLKKVADDYQAKYLDIYTDMKALPQAEKEKLLDPNDGLHLADKGKKYLTFQYLKFIADIY